MISEFPYVVMDKNEKCSPGTEITTAWECAHAVSYASTMGFNASSEFSKVIPGDFEKLPVGCSAVSAELVVKGGRFSSSRIHRGDLFFFNNNNELGKTEIQWNELAEYFLFVEPYRRAAVDVNWDSMENLTMICKKGTNQPIYFE